MNLIVGYGQIGQAVHKVIGESEIYDSKDSDMEFTVQPDVLHICFPYSDKFVEQVKWYITGCKPWHVVIWSTVPIGTTKKIKGAVHSPVEGSHPQLARSIKESVRWLGANDKEEAKFFSRYFKDLFMTTRGVENSDFTEFLKLRSTSKYGINLVWTNYEAMVSEQIGMDFELLKDFDRDYNKLYHNLDMNWAQRYILDPPNNKIGGHCVIPNAELLDKQFPSELLKMIGRMK